MKNIFRLAFKNIYSARKKSFSAILAIASGFLALNLFQSYIYEVTLIFDSTYSERSMYGDALIRYQKRHDFISSEEQNTIDQFLKANESEILSSVRNLYFAGSANNGQQQFYFLGLGYEINQGEQLRGSHWKNNSLYGDYLQTSSHINDILIGQGFSQNLGCTPDKKMTIPIEKKGYRHSQIPFKCDFNLLQLSTTTTTGQVNAIESKVIGIVDGLFKELDDRYVVSSLAMAQSLTNSKNVSYYALKLKEKESLLSMQKKFKELGMNSELALKPWQEYDIGDFYQQSISFLTLFKNFFSAIVITISTLSVMATFYRLINERKKEIGIYRSIGFKNNYIFKLFILESFLLSLSGVLIGFVLSLLIATTFNSLAIPYSLGMLTQPVAFSMSFNYKIIVFSSGVMILSSMIFGGYPVYKAMKLKITEILIEN